jgi:hypothetical protein
MSDFYTDADEGPGSPWDRVGRELRDLEREVGPEEARRIWNSRQLVGRARRPRNTATPRARDARGSGAPPAYKTYPGDDLALPRDTPRRDLQPPISQEAREWEEYERRRGHDDV